MEAEPAERPAPARRGRGWRIVGFAGEVLITLGALFLLLVVYDLWWTNVVAGQAIAQERDELVNTWREEVNPVPTPPIPSEAFALMYIPSLGSDVWGTPLIEGVSEQDLTRGIGRFPESALPGEVGNVAFAGHRATHGEPLRNVDQLRAGDMVYIATATGWYSYRLTSDQIVLPTDIWVVDPVPGAPQGTVPTDSTITLLTCHPRWGSTQRWVWWGELAEVRSRAQGPPTELADLLEAP